jgi:hypothetical protein
MTEPSTAAARPQQTEELTRLREENLRLRDLLIARDAELGLLKGQVAALEAGTARLLGLVNLFRSLMPGFVWRGMARVARAVRRG